MRDRDADGCVIAIALVVAALFGAGRTCYVVGRDEVRAQAIEANVAHWEVNEITGERQFVFEVPE